MYLLISGIIIGFMSIVGTSVILGYDSAQREFEKGEIVQKYNHE